MVIKTVEEQREQRFQDFLVCKEKYFAQVEANGNEPWHEGDIEARRELFMRRYTRPEPPSALPALTTDQIRGSD